MVRGLSSSSHSSGSVPAGQPQGVQQPDPGVVPEGPAQLAEPGARVVGALVGEGRVEDHRAIRPRPPRPGSARRRATSRARRPRAPRGGTPRRAPPPPAAPRLPPRRALRRMRGRGVVRDSCGSRSITSRQVCRIEAAGSDSSQGETCRSVSSSARRQAVRAARSPADARRDRLVVEAGPELATSGARQHEPQLVGVGAVHPGAQRVDAPRAALRGEGPGEVDPAEAAEACRVAHEVASARGHARRRTRSGRRGRRCASRGRRPRRPP